MSSDIDLVLQHVAQIPIPSHRGVIMTTMPREVIMAARRAIEPSPSAQAWQNHCDPGPTS